jgi:hypothetical protein
MKIDAFLEKQLLSKLHPSLLRCHHIQGDILQSISKAVRQSHCPLISAKSNLTPSLLAMNMPMLLLES